MTFSCVGWLHCDTISHVYNEAEAQEERKKGDTKRGRGGKSFFFFKQCRSIWDEAFILAWRPQPCVRQYVCPVIHI